MAHCIFKLQSESACNNGYVREFIFLPHSNSYVFFFVSQRLLDTLNEIKKKIEEMASESFDLLEEARDLLVEADSTLYV